MVVNKKQLADILGVSERTLTEWQDWGMPIMSVGGRGMENQYDTAVVIEWRIQRALAGAKRETEKERKDRLEADLLELRIEEKTAGLVPADIIEAMWTSAILAARAQLRALPDALKAAVDGDHGIDMDIALPTRLVDDALQKLSEKAPIDDVDHNEPALEDEDLDA